MKPINGITILYADDIKSHSLYNEEIDLNFRHIITEDAFHRQPQSKRIQWCKDMCEELLKRGTPNAFVTNDYYLIRIIESIIPIEKFQIYHMDTKATVSKFVDIKPNPTLVVAHYVFVQSVSQALKKTS